MHSKRIECIFYRIQMEQEVDAWVCARFTILPSKSLFFSLKVRLWPKAANVERQQNYFLLQNQLKIFRIPSKPIMSTIYLYTKYESFSKKYLALSWTKKSGLLQKSKVPLSLYVYAIHRISQRTIMHRRLIFVQMIETKFWKTWNCKNSIINQITVP